MSDIIDVECQIDGREALYRAYMPFIEQCGLFVKTDQSVALGDSVRVNFTLKLDKAETGSFVGNVIWITPPNAQDDASAGVGVQFSSMSAEGIRGKIETCLLDAEQSEQSTDTM